VIVNGSEIVTDAEGYLTNHADWREEVALAIARQENIEMSDAHWEVVHFVRDFLYATFTGNLIPLPPCACW